MSEEKSYVIGTHEAEIARLGVQHRVWRSSTLDLWRLGGLTEGMVALDVGAGPGYASLDLAEVIGARGRVIAVERSHRFLDHLREAANARGVANIETIEADLLDFDWPQDIADFAWCRWVLAFINRPEMILEGIARALKPGGTLTIHEYYDYGSWHLAPPSAAFDSYVAKIIAKWRASGSEPDVGLSLMHLLPQCGLEISSVRPAVFTARMIDFAARWPNGFARGYLPVMENDGDITTKEAQNIVKLLDRYEADPNALVITPGVLQIVARKL
jgi:ubiquinone/menaquinone biosynthesis C-methylase UbiE